MSPSSNCFTSLLALSLLLVFCFDLSVAHQTGGSHLLRSHRHSRLRQLSSLSQTASPSAADSNRNDTSSMSKRSQSGRFTFFDVGLGACGKVNKDSDMIVALNIEQWAGGSHCFEKILMHYGGKSMVAQITDLCPSCPYGALDLSPSLFKSFADQDLGVIEGEWEFMTSGSGSSNSDKPEQPKPKPTQDEKPAPPPKPAPTQDDAPKSTTKARLLTSSKTTVTSHSSTTTTSSNSQTTELLGIPTAILGTGTIAIAAGLNTNGTSVLQHSSSKSTQTTATTTSSTSFLEPTLTTIDIAPSAPVFETTSAVMIPPPSAENPSNLETLNRVIINLGALIAELRQSLQQEE